jgi:radical SAM superfamily enzyme YgiQ (UPF0313 family)
MYQAGYYKLRIGIETASEKVAQAMRKKIEVNRLVDNLKVAKSIGMKMYGTFTFGAPESNREEDLKTVRLIKYLLEEALLDDLQISICTPQPGTPFHQMAKERGFLLTEDWVQFDGVRAVVSYPDYPAQEIEEVFALANGVFQNSASNRKIRKQGIGCFLLQKVRKDGVIKTATDAVKKIGREVNFKRMLK